MLEPSSNFASSVLDQWTQVQDLNGAETLIRTLAAGGVEVCFTNPGTSEIHIVAALDRVPEIRCVLGLFEGVVTGAADGYARMTGIPACTLLHLGPGLANGLANLHNASRAQVPIINIVGQHATFHLAYDTPLTSDIEGIARPYSRWLKTTRSASEIGSDAAEAILRARTSPGQIATLIVPADVAWSDGGEIAAKPLIPDPPMPSAERIEHAAAMLLSGLPTALLLSGNVLYGEGLAAAGAVAARSNATLFCPYPFARMERGAGYPRVIRIPYILEQAVDQLQRFRNLILVGAAPPVAYFAYPGKNSILTSPDCEIHELTTSGEDNVGALQALSDCLPRSEAVFWQAKASQRVSLPSGDITLSGIASAIGAILPENAIVVDESMTSGRGLMAATQEAPPHDWLANTGGSIGIALPLAVGASVASPDRPVLCLTADGSGMYTAQALWTMARENLNITSVAFANRSYAVLKREFFHLGIGNPGPRASGLFEIDRPDLNWALLAKSMGVPGIRARSLEEFGRELQDGLAGTGPRLIELCV